MTTKEIIEKSFENIINSYDLEFVYETNGKENYYYLKNDNGNFIYYELPQSGDYRFSVVIHETSNRVINMFEEYPKIIANYNATYKGVMWILRDKRKDYWDMIASIIKIEIEKNESIFGLKVLKKKFLVINQFCG